MRIGKMTSEIEPGYYQKVLQKNKIQYYWHNKKFELVSQKIHSLPILDIGSGSGVFINLLCNLNGVKINLDYSYQQLKYGKVLNPHHAYYVNAYATSLPFKSNSLETVCLIETIEHLDPYAVKELLKETFRVLKDNGKVIISTPNYKSLWPLFELIISVLWPINYIDQHITHFYINKLTRYVESAGFAIESKETFFVFSPLLALISKNLSNFFYKFEQIFLKSLGSIILIKAIKTIKK